MSLNNITSVDEVGEIEKRIKILSLNLIELVENRSKLTNKKGGITIKGEHGNKVTVTLYDEHVSDSESNDDYFSESDSPTGDRSLSSSMLVPKTKTAREKLINKSRSYSGGEARINRLNTSKSPQQEQFRKR